MTGIGKAQCLSVISITIMVMIQKTIMYDTVTIMYDTERAVWVYIGLIWEN